MRPVRRRDALERLRQRQPPRVRRVPGRGRGPQRRAGLAHARIAAARSCGDADARDEPVDALLDQLGRRVVGVGDDDARRPRRARLDDDEPVALAARGQDHAQRAPQRVVDARRVDEARRRDRVREPGARSAPSTAPRSGPVAEDLGPQLRRPPRSARRHQRRARASPGCGARRTRRRRVDIRLDPSLSVAARVLALEHRHLAAHALARAAARRAGARSRTPAAGSARRPAAPASRPSRRHGRGSRASTSASTARASRRPAGNRASAAATRPRAGRSTGTRRYGRRRSGAARAADGRTRRARRRAAAGCGGGRPRVQRQPRPDRDDADARHARTAPRGPTGAA